MTILMSGINMYAMALVMKVVLGWNIHFSIWVSSLTVAVYVVSGGLFSAIFNEVLQFFLIWLGALLIPILGLVETGGWTEWWRAFTRIFPAGLHAPVGTLGTFSGNPMGVHWTGMVFGMGCAIACGYWTTDFLVVQRVLAAKDLRAAQNGADHRLVLQDGGAVHRDSARTAGPRGVAFQAGSRKCVGPGHAQL